MGKNIVAIDLFCGAGGLTKGLSDSGIRVIKGYDLDNRVSKTYEKNNKNSKFFHLDIVNLKKDNLTKNINIFFELKIFKIKIKKAKMPNPRRNKDRAPRKFLPKRKINMVKNINRQKPAISNNRSKMTEIIPLVSRIPFLFFKPIILTISPPQ